MNKANITETRKCVVCGSRVKIYSDNNGKYAGGHYFGELKLPIEGTGKWKKTGKTKIGGRSYDVVDWTGKEKKMEYWECNACFEKAGHATWLEETIEELYGKRCIDYDAGCACCQAWNVFDTIRDEVNGQL